MKPWEQIGAERGSQHMEERVTGENGKGNPICWYHHCDLENIDWEAQIGQCVESGAWWSFAHLNLKKKEPKKIRKISNGELIETEEDAEI